jgi:hypothetical protein
MSIEKLRQIARLDLPFTVSTEDEVVELRVLMNAGLIVGLCLKVPCEARPQGGATDPAAPGTAPPRAVAAFRVLAITPEGRRLLRRCAERWEGPVTP